MHHGGRLLEREVVGDKREKHLEVLWDLRGPAKSAIYNAESQHNRKGCLVSGFDRDHNIKNALARRGGKFEDWRAEYDDEIPEVISTEILCVCDSYTMASRSRTFKYCEKVRIDGTACFFFLRDSSGVPQGL